MTRANTPVSDVGDPDIAYLIDHIINVKEATVAGYDGDPESNADLLPVVGVQRGGEFIAWVLGTRVDRDQGLTAAHFAIVGFGADEIVLGLDARMKIYDKDSDEPYVALEPGELQRIAETVGYENGKIVEAIIIIHHRRDGHVQMAHYPYVTHKADDGKTHWIEWLTEKIDHITVAAGEDDSQLQGVVIDSLRDSWRAADLIPDLSVAGKEFDLTETEARIHADCAVLKICHDSRLMVMYNADTKQKEAILRSSTEGGALKGITPHTLGDLFSE